MIIHADIRACVLIILNVKFGGLLTSGHSGLPISSSTMLFGEIKLPSRPQLKPRIVKRL